MKYIGANVTNCFNTYISRICFQPEVIDLTVPEGPTDSWADYLPRDGSIWGWAAFQRLMATAPPYALYLLYRICWRGDAVGRESTFFCVLLAALLGRRFDPRIDDRMVNDFNFNYIYSMASTTLISISPTWSGVMRRCDSRAQKNDMFYLACLMNGLPDPAKSFWRV